MDKVKSNKNIKDNKKDNAESDFSLSFNIILLGRYYFRHNDLSYYIKLLSAKEKALIKLDLHNTKEELESQNLITNDELIMEAEKRKTWSSLQQKQFDELPKKIKRMRSSISENGEFFARKEKKVIAVLIKNAEEKLNEVQEKHIRIVENSIETLLNLRELKLTLYYSMYYEDDKRVFSHYSEVGHDEKYSSLMEMLNKTLELFSESMIRRIARSNVWFSIYSAGEQCADGVWKVGSSELSDEQLLLLAWTRRYENIYKDPDAPEESVINNDKALDEWVKQREEEFRKSKKQQAGKNFGTSKSFVPKTPFDRREVYIMSDKEHAQDVYDMNGPGARAKIKAEQAKINSKKKLSDVKLRVIK